MTPRGLGLAVAAVALACGCVSVVGAGEPPGGALETRPSDSPRNIVLVSWDGLDRAVVRELLSDGRLPHLARLMAEGSFQDIEVRGHPTVTKPGHAEMLTGLAAGTTGVLSNARYRPIPEGYTIFERVQTHLGGRASIRTIMVSSKLAHVGGRSAEEVRAWTLSRQQRRRPQLPRVRRGRAAPAAREPDPSNAQGEPLYLTRKALDVFDAEHRRAPATGDLCLKYLDEFSQPRFLAFFHFADPDEAGHRSGRDSSDYRDAAVACDEQLGRIIGWLEQQGLYSVTLIYVTTDHGFDEHARTHGNAPHGWLATNDRSVCRGGIPADVPATILARFGLDTANLEPPLIGAPLTQPAPAPTGGAAAPAEPVFVGTGRG